MTIVDKGFVALGAFGAGAGFHFHQFMGLNPILGAAAGILAGLFLANAAIIAFLVFVDLGEGTSQARTASGRRSGRRFSTDSCPVAAGRCRRYRINKRFSADRRIV